MIAWLVLSDPARTFYSVAAPAGASDLRFDRLVSVSALERQLSTGGGGQSANMSAVLDNADGALTAELSGELGKSASVKYIDSAGSEKTLFTGSIQSITLSDSARLELVA